MTSQSLPHLLTEYLKYEQPCVTLVSCKHQVVVHLKNDVQNIQGQTL